MPAATYPLRRQLYKRYGFELTYQLNNNVLQRISQCLPEETKLMFFNHLLGWSGVAKVSCFLGHRGAQLIFGLQLGKARPAILVAGKGRGECFYFF